MNQPSFSLEGKVSLITGGARGIGQAIALGLANAGADITIGDISAAEMRDTIKEIEKVGGKSLGIETDVGTQAGRDRLVKETMAQFGRIDILVNNAALGPSWGPVIEVGEEEWGRLMDLNLKSCFFLSQAVAKEAMIPQKRGNIVNLASLNSFRPTKGSGVYAISKAGVWMLTQVLASEWAQYGIRVNAIAPRLVQTKMIEALLTDPEALKLRLRMNAQGRIAQPEEMVGAVIYLASDASSYVTGHTILLTGGIGIY